MNTQKLPFKQSLSRRKPKLIQTPSTNAHSYFVATKPAGGRSKVQTVQQLKTMGEDFKLGTLLPILAVVVIILWLVIMHLVVKPTPLANLYNDLQNQKATFGLTIYVPSSLPQGFSYTRQAPSQTDKILTYYLSFDAGKRLSISDRPRPKDINFDDFYRQNLNNRLSVPSSQGQAVIGNANNQAVGSLLTNQVWVIVSSSLQLDNTRLTQLVSGLKPLP